MRCIECSSIESVTSIRCLAALSFFDRACGLLRFSPQRLHKRRAAGMYFDQVKSVHTIGMRYPIDVAFVDKSSCVIATYCNVPQGRVLVGRGATSVIERFASSDPWFSRGEHVCIKQCA